MNAYQPRTDDMQFVLSRVLNAPAQLQALPAFAEVDPELMQQVLDEAGKFVGEVIAPLNRDGDEIGAQWKDGAVTMPPGFKDAYQSFWQSGWPALAASAEARAHRRFQQLEGAGVSTTIEGLLAGLRERDARDQNRAIAPLKPAADAVLLDNSTLSIESTVETVQGLWEQHRPFA